MNQPLSTTPPPPPAEPEPAPLPEPGEFVIASLNDPKVGTAVTSINDIPTAEKMTCP